MGRKRTSIVWKVDQEELVSLVKNSGALADVLRAIGLDPKGRNLHTLKQRLEEENIDYSHIPMGRGSNRNRTGLGRDKKPLSEVMVKDSIYPTNNLKKRLLREGILENKCSICGLGPEWNGKELVLQLDHINGDSKDHRLENLQIICPNCHTQTDNYAGRGKRKYYCECGNEKHKLSTKCNSCQGKLRRKVERPPKKELKKDIEEMSWVAIGRKYGVSDNAVRKWAKAYKLIEV